MLRLVVRIIASTESRIVRNGVLTVAVGAVQPVRIFRRSVKTILPALANNMVKVNVVLLIR
jgi:hypothetical protein